MTGSVPGYKVVATWKFFLFLESFSARWKAAIWCWLLFSGLCILTINSVTAASRLAYHESGYGIYNFLKSPPFSIGRMSRICNIPWPKTLVFKFTVYVPRTWESIHQSIDADLLLADWLLTCWRYWAGVIGCRFQVLLNTNSKGNLKPQPNLKVFLELVRKKRQAFRYLLQTKGQTLALKASSQLFHGPPIQRQQLSLSENS
ncbi:hypothetical protein VNO77_26029 [Canavalia gladiata]|uniref:Uncharacterized protein n=1 Tax=Canavalia gladiata TaxID=3824 RepID=A0AAN9Q5Z5_CANGL